jgi:hypothetical protein
MNQKEMKLKRPSRIFKNRRRPVLFSALTMLVALALAVPALASAPGTLDPFQPSDALPDCNPSPTINLNNPTTHHAPVPVTCDPPGAPTQDVTVTWVSDTPSGNATDDAWGQGDKSDCFLAKTGGVNGACVTQVYGIGASKTDLQYHGIGLERGSNGHFYLYSGIKRLQAGGITSSNANYNVEVNQLKTAYQPASPICPLVAPNTGGCNMWRSPGDLTFMTDWGGNQSSCGVPTPAICAYVWIDFSTGTGKTPSPAGSTCFNAQSAPCWGLLPGGSAKLSDNPLKAAGSINSTAAVQPSTFSEIGVDLNESGLVEPGACETFRNVWAHSRSSSSFSAELKDFIFGDVTISTCSATTTLLHERTDINGSGDVQSGLELTVSPGAFVNDVATVTAGATGSVNFRYYSDFDACDADDAGTAGTNVSTNALSGGTPNTATSGTVQFSTVGNFYWRAFYLGDGLSPSASECNEIVHVRQIATAISTDQSWLPQDSATITPNVAGTVVFSLYETNGTCSGAADRTFTDTDGSDGFATSNATYYTTSKTISWSATFTPTDTTTYLGSTTTRCERSDLTINNSASVFPPAP